MDGQNPGNNAGGLTSHSPVALTRHQSIES
jgi:hypothetical protein